MDSEKHHEEVTQLLSHLELASFSFAVCMGVLFESGSCRQVYSLTC